MFFRFCLFHSDCFCTSWTNQQRPNRLLPCGYWFGFGWFACGFSWVGNALLIDAAAFGWLYPLTLLAAGAFFGLFAGIPAALAWYFKNTYARWLAFASFWVILEWIRSFIFTGFPWNLLGSVLAFDDRGLQLASFFGTYGLSLLVLLCVSAPALIVIRRTRASAAAAAALICRLLGFGLHLRTTAAETLPSGKLRHYCSHRSAKHTPNHEMGSLHSLKKIFSNISASAAPNHWTTSISSSGAKPQSPMHWILNPATGNF